MRGKRLARKPVATTHVLDEARTTEITRFVRGCLGCRCPDEVFRSIVMEPAAAPDGALRFTRLRIGDRLLIYVLGPHCADELGTHLAPLTRLGRAERDRMGYRRFRLVVPTTNVDRTSAVAAALFAHAAGEDDRAHLHVVHASDVPGSCVREKARSGRGH